MQPRDILIAIIGAVILAAILVFITTPKPVGNTLDLNNLNENQSASTNVASSSGQLTVIDTKIGDGREVKSGDTIVIHYTGTLQDGTKFDSSYDLGQPFTTQIGTGQVIKGWDQGIIGMKVGGKRHLVIPPDLGYGSTGAGDKIPPNSTLVFDVELMEIK